MTASHRTRGVLSAMALAFIGLSAGAFAQPQREHVSPDFVLAGCRALVENDPNGDMMQMGACAGAVSAIVELARAQHRACPPPDAGLVHAARLVISYFDEQPALQSQPFGPNAWRAMEIRWECRR